MDVLVVGCGAIGSTGVNSVGLVAAPGMTLIAAHISAERIELLADGLSCHDNLTIKASYQVGTRTVLAKVPGRTTLQKLFSHPELPVAIAHSGSNQRNGVPIRKIIEEFWQDAICDGCVAEDLAQRLSVKLGSRVEDETFWVVGFGATGDLALQVIGRDFERIGTARCWSGSGRDGLSPSWADLESLRQAGERFLADCQEDGPFSLPFFANCFGGHWHRLQITVGEAPRWRDPPIRRGVKVDSLLPSSPMEVRCDNPAEYTKRRGNELKGLLRRKFNRRVRGSLEKISSANLRERVARLIAVFDEVELDSEVATEEDAQTYAGALEAVVAELNAGQ